MHPTVSNVPSNTRQDAAALTHRQITQVLAEAVRALRLVALAAYHVHDGGLRLEHTGCGARHLTQLFSRGVDINLQRSAVCKQLLEELLGSLLQPPPPP